MRVYLRARAKWLLLFIAVFIAVLSGARDIGVRAQEPPQRWDGLIELISGRYDYPPPTSTPPQPADGPSQMSRHAVSGDGRYVLFNANAPILGYYDMALYIRDRRTSETRVLLGGPALNAALSADGNHIAFEICDPYGRPQPRPDDPSNICDVYALDLRNWAWVLMSATPDGTFANADSRSPVLSANGRFIVFRTHATNLPAPGTPPGQIVLRDRDADGNGTFDEPGTAVVEIVSVSSGGEPGQGLSETAEVSDDGRYVAFRSSASNLVPGDTNNVWDVFRRDRQTGETRRLNVRPEGQESTSSIDSPQISMTPDGRYVAFTSDDGFLAPSSFDDYNGMLDVFIYDAQSPFLTRIDIGWGPPIAMGYVPGNGPTQWPSLSADGRYVSLQSAATNVEVPPLPGSTHPYVVDRLMQTATRVSVKPDGSEPDNDCVRPAISADGSLVAFLSQAMNLASNVYWPHDRIYAAVHLEITPPEVFVSGGGGSAAFTVTTQQHTQWWVDWTDWPSWLSTDSFPAGVGSGTVAFRAWEANPNPTPRSATIRIAEQSAVFTQLEGLSLTSVSPASGPDTGGTRVTVTGTGFEPGMRVVFDGYDAVTEFVSSTTLIATTPPHAPATVWVAVFAAAPDFRSAWIDQAFRYTDTTPPQIWYGLSGTEGQDGWFRSDVTLSWVWWDPESAVTSTTGCDTVVVTTDTGGSTFTCSATSEGGTASASATVKRDTTPPTAAISSPAATLYDTGAVVLPAFTCSDALSGSASCTGSTGGDPIDTLTPGYHTFSVTATDRAGNVGLESVEYAISSGACAYPLPDLPAWWRMEGDTLNATSNTLSSATRVGLTSDVYVDAVVGQGYQFEGANGYLNTGYSITVHNDKKLAIAAWMKPSANTYGTILRKKDQYSVARTTSGSIAWAFRRYGSSTLSYTDTGVRVPLNVWSHVVVALDVTHVKTYVNGRLAHAEPVQDVDDYWARYDPITIGGAEDRAEYFKGVLDEVQIHEHGVDAARVEMLFLAGTDGGCVHKRTAFEIVEPIPAAYGDQTYPIDIRLVDEAGTPVAGRTVNIDSLVGAWPYSTSTADRVTDADGRVHWDAPLKNAPRGLYEEFVYVTFAGDVDYVRQYTEPDVLVGMGTPVIAWATPAPITYGTFLSSTQLNATSSVPGTFAYSPPSGTGLPAGTHTLATTFTPNDTYNYNNATASVSLTVNKATPVVTVTGGTFTYDAAPHAATGTVKNQWGITIGAPTFTYNGSPDAPIDAGSYTVIASYAGSANYEAASATTTLTIDKATPTVAVTGGTFTYDGQPHAATGTVTGGGGASLGPLTFTYGGSTNAPVNAGSYDIVGSFAGDANHAPASGTATLTIAKATPAVTVNDATFTYDGSPHAATGTVTGVGGASLGPLTFTYNASPVAPVNAGTYDVVGSYAGDGNYDPAIGTATITVTKGTPVLSWAQPAAIVYGTPLGGAQLNATSSVAGAFAYAPGAGAVLGAGSGQTLTATFTPTDAANYNEGTVTTSIDVSKATPTMNISGGTYTYDAASHAASGLVTGVGGEQLGPINFTYNGSAAEPINAGTYDVVGTYGGNPNYSSVTATTTLTITKTAVVLSWSQPAGIVYGTPLGAAQLAATSNVAGTFVYAPAAGTVLNAGTGQALGATFTPADAQNYTGGSAGTTIDVAPAPLAIRASDASKRFGAPLPAFTASASGFVNGDAFASLSGTLVFSTPATQASPVGTYPIVPSGVSSPNYATTFLNGTLTIVRGAVTLSVSASPEPSGLDQPMTFTATVAAAAPAAGQPTGAVRFFDGATLVGNAALASGSASLTTAGLDAGTRTIEARYDGDGSFETGTQSSAHVVNDATSTPSISIAASRNPSSTGQSVTLTANVSMPAGAVTGTVEFYSGATLLGSSAISAGRATFTTSSLAAGSHAITARYLGSGGAPPARSGVFVQAVGSAGWKNRATTMTLSDTPNPSALGDTVVLTANVTGSSSAMPTGRILFMVNGEVVGDPAGIAVTPVSGTTARATFSVAGLNHGRHKVTATYLGESTYKGSTASVTQTVN